MFIKTVMLTAFMFVLAALAAATLPAPASADVSPHCDVKPPKVELSRPLNYAHLVAGGETLDWNGVRCATSYTITVRIDSPDGQIVDIAEGRTKTRYTPNAKLLSAGHSYYWQVKACNRFGCSRSHKFSFVILPPQLPRTP